MRRVALASLFAASAATSCGGGTRTIPPAEIVLYVDTDAPLPPAGGARADPLAPTPLFDRLRIEVYPPGATDPCAGCVNDFAIDTGTLRAVAASVGIAPPLDTDGYRAKVTLYPTQFVGNDGTPDPDGAVAVFVALPKVPAATRIELTVFAPTDSVGAPVGSLDAPSAATPGKFGVSRVGTWAGAARASCANAPRAGEACVPGGAYWMGDVQGRGPWPILPDHDENRPRLVTISPFFLDTTEVTVAAYRAGGGASPGLWNGSDAGTTTGDFCTFTRAPGKKDDYPLVCVGFLAARKFCQSRGGDLPSEAQYEYAASGLVGNPFVWGADEPTCADATFGRIGYGIFSQGSAPCKPPSAPGGPTTVGSGARDRLTLPTGVVVDLAGNAAEWMLDQWNRQHEPCWAQPGVYADPVCQGQSSVDGSLRSIRGGDWLVTAGQLTRNLREAAPPSYVSPELGFRCARADAP